MAILHAGFPENISETACFVQNREGVLK